MEYQLFSYNFSSATDSSLKVVFALLALLFKSTWMPVQYYRYILHSINSSHYISAKEIFCFYFLKQVLREYFCTFLSSGIFWWFSNFLFWSVFREIRQCQKYVSYLQQLSVQSECFFYFYFLFSAENKKGSCSPYRLSSVNPPWQTVTAVTNGASC